MGQSLGIELSSVVWLVDNNASRPVWLLVKIRMKAAQVGGCNESSNKDELSVNRTSCWLHHKTVSECRELWGFKSIQPRVELWWKLELCWRTVTRNWPESKAVEPFATAKQTGLRWTRNLFWLQCLIRRELNPVTNAAGPRCALLPSSLVLSCAGSGSSISRKSTRKWSLKD